MPKYKPAATPHEFLDTNKSMKERFDAFENHKTNILLGEKNPYNKMYIFILYTKHYETLKNDFENDPEVESFDDSDIDNVILMVIEDAKQMGFFEDANKHLLHEKINKQCRSEGKKPLMPK